MPDLPQEGMPSRDLPTGVPKHAATVESKATFGGVWRAATMEQKPDKI
jgi:hypothetical protein